MTPIQRHLPSHRDHGRAARSGDRLPVGSSSRRSPPSRPTPSRRPTRSPTPSTAATCADLKDELGDLLLQVVYHARMAEEQQRVRLRRRRRGDHRQDDPPPPARVRHARPSAQPAPRRASGTAPRPRRRRRTQQAASLGRRAGRAARPDARRQVAEQSRQGRLRLAVARACVRQARRRSSPSSRRRSHRRRRAAADLAAIEEEFGDLLFVVANVARHLKIDPEGALRAANEKFIRRFRFIEARLAEQGRTPAQSDLAEMDALWDEAKAKGL